MIYACVFLQFKQETGEFPIANEKPYYYYSSLDLPRNSKCLVHNGKEFGIVQIVDRLTSVESKGQATKSLLCPIHFNSLNYVQELETISTMLSTAQLERIRNRISTDLRTPATTPNEGD